jgi:hypothetical protein
MAHTKTPRYVGPNDDQVFHDDRMIADCNLRGDVSGLIGDVSRLIGDVSELRGDVSGLRGNVSGLRGRVLPGAEIAVSMGSQNGYDRLLQGVNGVAWVTSGCWEGTLAQTIAHWQSHVEDRTLSLCMIPAYRAVAAHLGLVE